MSRPSRYAVLLPIAVAAALAVPAAAAGAHRPSARQPRPSRHASRYTPAPVVEKVSLEIRDLKTADEVTRVTGALYRVVGVKTAIIDLRTGLAVVDYDPRQAALPRFLLACQSEGFPASEYRVEQRFPKPIKLKGG